MSALSPFNVYYEVRNKGKLKKKKYLFMKYITSWGYRMDFSEFGIVFCESL